MCMSEYEAQEIDKKKKKSMTDNLSIYPEAGTLILITFRIRIYTDWRGRCNKESISVNPELLL